MPAPDDHLPARQAAEVPGPVLPGDFRSLPGAYVVLAPDLTIVDATDEYLQASGKERGEIVGQAVLDVFPQTSAGPDPHAPARAAAAEYRRALLDYTQLVRHRLANPLTAITAGVATLRDLEDVLDRSTRMEILDAMTETAARLERAVLHPELDTGVEEDLKVVPQVDADLAGLIEVVAVKAEQHSRAINERVATQLSEFGARSIEVFCECWAPQCDGVVEMSLREYFSVHERDDQFVICPGHDLPAIEDVVDRRDDLWIVRKTSEALQAAGEDGSPGV